MTTDNRVTAFLDTEPFDEEPEEPYFPGEDDTNDDVLPVVSTAPTVPSLRTLADHLPGYFQKHIDRVPPIRWSFGNGAGHDRIDAQPNRLIVIGGPTASGKTAWLTQGIFTALHLDQELRAYVANVELDEDQLTDREMARLSDIPLPTLQLNAGADHAADFAAAGRLLASVADRVIVHPGAPVMADVAACAADFGAQIVVLDYIQRFKPSTRANDSRARTEANMAEARELAKQGRCVIAASALSRDGAKAADAGEPLRIEHLRDSSELEYGADQIILIGPAAGHPLRGSGRRLISGGKERNRAHGWATDPHFDGAHQRFADDAPDDMLADLIDGEAMTEGAA